MCITPCTLDNGEMVACRYCWQCRKNRVNDLVGRCIAEQEYSSQTLAVTMTYGGDVKAAATLIYEDFQKFMKRLRKKYSVRYIVAGEYGSKKGRAHWHAILFFRGKAPQIKPTISDCEGDDICLERNLNWKHWPHGFVLFQQPSYRAFSYLLKYVLKDQQQQVAVTHLAMSKKPPLGFEYVDDYAQRYVDDGLAPQHYFYKFPHVFDAAGRRRQFLMQGKTRENFVTSFQSKWQEQKGTPPPYSEALEEFNDKCQGEINDMEMTMGEQIERKKQWPKYVDPTGSGEDMNQVEAKLTYCEGTVLGVSFIGIEAETIDRKKSMTIYTERGEAWHVEGEKLRHAKNQRYLSVRYRRPYNKEYNERFVRWKDEHGLFGRDGPLPWV